ncbi:MAG: hypothetical protein JJLCMIEE_01306 [Acidimicrobiales bacterium]|nr:MAG: HAMP domain-containing protein [Actinomycetota bacterium]MBV6508246.1 hypothetical protein [Acidimicrobiales bacterium]RIK07317.1 MAG: hypothetical protein DCC48_04365 [Acidobacteriota bacterium]
MLSRFKVGTKLAAILIAPLAVLVAVTSIGVRERLDDSAAALADQRMAELSQAGSDLVNSLQLERMYSMAYTANPEAVPRSELDDRRAATDAGESAFGEMTMNLDLESLPELSAALAESESATGALPSIREDVDSGNSSTSTVEEEYTAIIDALLAVSTAVVDSASSVDFAQELAAAEVLSDSKEATALEAGLVAALLAESTDPGISLAQAQEALAEAERLEALFLDTAPEDAVELFGSEMPTLSSVGDEELSEGDSAQHYMLSSIGSITSMDQVTFTLDEWFEAAETRFESLLTVESRMISTAGAGAIIARSEADRTARLYIAWTAVAIVVALAAAYLVSRSITRPLGRLTTAARELSSKELPRLVESLRSPEVGHEVRADLKEIEVSSSDEIGELADAFNRVQETTLEVAEEQANMLRRGISEIFVSLARRNQTLLDRQIEFIDELEAHEEEPDQLENLFKLDHLATRMRRNAESLLVLAGAEPPRRRGRPVALADVVRVAVGEVEDFQRISLLALDEVTISGNVAVDLAHVLSELMENATQFSPPETMVEIVGHRNGDGGYVLSVADQGIGMAPEQLAEANRQLAKPPLVGLSLARSLGFIVVGRLSARFGIEVQLTTSPSGGVTALVTIPASHVIADDGDPTATLPVVRHPSMDPHEGRGLAWQSLPPEDPEPASLRAAIPEGAEFDAGIASLIESAPHTENLARIEMPEERVSKPPAARTLFAGQPPPEEAETAGADSTRSPSTDVPPLPKRRPAERALRDISVSPVRTGASGAGLAGTRQRSPEEVRRMLSRYRTGLKRGRTPDGGTAPSNGSGNDTT